MKQSGGGGPWPAGSGPDSERVEQVQHLLTEVTEEEYDYALRRHAAACRPFAAAMGDHRCAARCVTDYPVRDPLLLPFSSPPSSFFG